MQQRQLRLGDTLDDYCPRERRLTNHVIVAMVGDDVKQTRCTTCDSDHEYKHAKVPRQRKKSDTPAALYAQVAAGAPKRVAHDPASGEPIGDLPAEDMIADEPIESPVMAEAAPESVEAASLDEDDHEAPEGDASEDEERDTNDGPIHRRLIRASLPRPEGQQPPARPIPEFTIRQPGGRPNRFRPRHARGGGGQSQHFGNRSNGNFGGPMRGGGGNHQRHHGGGRKRSK
jgi:hypothetical protein